MSTLDFVKAFGVALLLMVLNVAIAFGVMAIYGNFIDPGHTAEFYQMAALRIAPWSSVVAGSLLFFGAAWLLGVRRPQRSALLFALAFAAIYVLIDLIIIVSIDAGAVLSVLVALSVAGKFAGAILGAQLARRAKA